MKTQSPVVGVGCLPPLVSSCLRSVSPLASFFAPPLGPSCLLALYAHAVLIGSSARLSLGRSSLLIGSSARPLPRIAPLPAPFDKRDGAGTQTAAVGRRVNCGGCGVAACLPRDDGRGGSVISSSRLIGSSNLPSSHRGGSFFPFPPDPLSPALLCLLAGACSPVPGRGMCWLRYGLRRPACGLVRLLAVVSVPLSHCVRSLVAICSVSLASLCLLGTLWDILRAILTAYLSALAFLNICP